MTSLRFPPFALYLICLHDITEKVMRGRLTPVRVHSGCCTGAKISFWRKISQQYLATVSASRWAGTGSVCILFLINAIFAFWIHAYILSICGVPSRKHDTNSPSHHVNAVRNQEVNSVLNSRLCEFSHVNNP